MTEVTPRPERALETAEMCDVCGSARTTWRKCKLVCLDCQAIVKSCADL